MENNAKLWDRSRSDQETFETFKKIVRINRVHSRSPVLDLAEPPKPQKDEFYNFISIIINPEQDSSMAKLIANLYEQIDLGALLSLFYRQTTQDFGSLNMDAIAKLRKVFEEVQ